MSETVDWAGLSSRLSAYSLSKDAPEPPQPESEDDEPEEGARGEDEDTQG
jgi:hypothetical protein